MEASLDCRITCKENKHSLKPLHWQWFVGKQLVAKIGHNSTGLEGTLVAEQAVSNWQEELTLFSNVF